MRNIKLLLQYDGAEFCGWQSQKQGERTVQSTLQEAVEKLTGDCSLINGSGRTDSGVHALAQVAAFETASEHSVQVIHRALNAMLPADLKVLTVDEAPLSFHPRKGAKSKRYAYIISNAPLMSPFARRYAWHVSYELDIDAMKEAALSLVGERDFKCFMAAGSSVKGTVRELRELSVIVSDRIEVMGLALGAPGGGRFIRIEAEGSGFLRHMVRNIAGTLIEVGKGAMEPAFMDELLASGDRGLAGPTAPSQGLFMVSVVY